MTTKDTSIKFPPPYNSARQKRQQLKELFPEVFAEGKIDFDALRRSLGDWVDPPGTERFGLSWFGKADCMRTIQQPSLGTLKPDRNASRDFDTSQNLVIEGDNLEVLKLLQTAYAGKVKMIYIDPPYNTGKEFIYPDRFSETLETYLSYTQQTDDHGRRWATNTEQDGRFHSKWLNMMFPRLYLARNLLREDGVIFISIDDHEQANLKLLCDYVFGEENFLGNLIWERAYAPKNDAKYISTSHDFVIFYAKSVGSFQIGRLPRTEEANARYRNPDNDPRGVWMPSDLSVKTYNAKYDYPITTPSGRVVEPPAGRCWGLSKEKFFEKLQDHRIWFGPDGNNVPLIKRFLSELRHEGMTPTSFLYYKDVGHSGEGSKEFVKLLNGDAHFDGPKPVRLIQRLLRISNSQADDLILDFFAGSGTTGHAVMQQNAEDGGRRRYILVQLPEPTLPDSEARRAGYRSIADITRERLRRAADRIAASQAGTLPLEGAAAPLDLGFRAFYLDRSNLRVWPGEIPEGENRLAELERQLELHVDHILPEATDEGLLFEFLLRYGFPLCARVKRLEVAGLPVLSVESDSEGRGGLLFCPAREGMTFEALEAMLDLQPTYTIVMEQAFKDKDYLLTNAVHAFRKRSEELGYELTLWTL